MARAFPPVPASLSTLLSKYFRVKSIRGQLTVGLTAALVPCLAIGFYGTQQYTRARFVAQSEQRLQSEAELISYGLNQWGKGTSRLVQTLAAAPSIRAGRVEDIQSVLDSVAAEDSSRIWHFWSASAQPKLLASAGGPAVTPAAKLYAERNQATRSYYQAALRGVATYEVVLSRITGTACLNAAHPVYRQASDNLHAFKDLGTAVADGDLLAQPVSSCSVHPVESNWYRYWPESVIY
jgi:hypothetical protein